MMTVIFIILAWMYMPTWAAAFVTVAIIAAIWDY